MTKSTVATIILPIACDKDFDYAIPAQMSLVAGMRVLVDFNGRRRIGLVAGIKEASSIRRLKSVIGTFEPNPLINETHFRFAGQLSNRYPYPASEFLFMMVPSYLKKPHKGTDLSVSLCPQDSVCIERIGSHTVSFVKGDTFIQRYQLWKDTVVQKLKEGSVLILFPQRSYLESVLALLARDFSREITVMHSQQGEKPLFDRWQKSRRNALILGTRMSAFYYPNDLRLIVVEDETNHCYFQEEKPFYHLRDVLDCLAQTKGVNLISSGEYPSLTTYKGIGEGTITLHEASHRAASIVPVELGQYKKRSILNPVFLELLRKGLEKKERTVVFFHRRGMGRIIACSSCGHVFTCSRCSAFLKFIHGQEQGVCPYCGKRRDLPHLCEHCKSGYLKTSGVGIERLGQLLKRNFPEARIASWETRTDASQIILSTAKILNALYTQERFDRGLVLDTDAFLARPDYESTFETFLYIRKLSSFFRKSLHVFTHNRNHYLFDALRDSSWKDFYAKELALRKSLHLPPEGILVKIIIRAKGQTALCIKAHDLLERLLKDGLQAYGPFCEQPFQLRSTFRYSVVIKAKAYRGIEEAVRGHLQRLRRARLKVAVIVR